MDFNIIDKYIARAVFIVAAVSAVLAFGEGFAQLLGHSIVARTYSAGRLLELAGILLIFVVVQLLRQIRDELRKT